MEKTIIIIMFFWAVCANAQDRWMQITTLPPDEKISYDKQTIEYDSDAKIYTVWIKYIFETPSDFGDGRLQKEQLVKFRFYCATRKHQTLYDLVYFVNGTQQELNIPDTKDEVIPDSPLETIFNYFCK